MKLLHTSDWHLGMTFKGRSTEEDQKYFADQIADIIKEKKVDAVLLAGDVFDRSLAGGDAVSLYDSFMTKIVGALDTPVLTVAGNHDGAERLSQCHELLKKTGLYVSGALEKEPMIAEFDDAQVFLIPWFSPEKAKAVFPEEAENIANLEDAWTVVNANLKKYFGKDKKHILVTHAYVMNAETSVSDKAAEIGTATAVGKFVFDGFDYVALGHIHKPQKITDTVRYSGSPMPYAFGKEEKQEKGVVIIDTDDMSQEFVPLKLLHKRTTITGTYDEILAADYPEDVRNGFVRLEVTDQYIGSDAWALFSERYPLLVETRGKEFDSDDADITMSMADFEKISENPEDIFKEFCREVKLDFNEERLAFFRTALDEYRKEIE